MSCAHWAREVEWLRSSAALPFGLRGRPSELRRVVVLWIVGLRRGALGCVQMRICTCSAGVGYRYWRRGDRSAEPFGCQRCELDRSCGACWCCIKHGGVCEKGSEFMAIRIRVPGGVGWQ